MPETIAAAFVAAGYTSVTAAGVTFVLQVAVVVSSALYNQSRAKAAARAAKNAYNAGLQDRQVVIRSAVAPRNIVYGKDKVSGPLVFGHSSGPKGEYLHLVVVLAAHECDAIEKIYFNEIELADPDGAGFIQSGPYSRNPTRTAQETTTASSIVLAHLPSRIILITQTDAIGEPPRPLTVGIDYTLTGSTINFITTGGTFWINYEWIEAKPVVRISKHLGAPGQAADADLIAESGGKWTAAHRGEGICYLYIRLEYDVDVFGQVGVPNIAGLARGKKLFDVRTGITVWSDNAALALSDYLRHVQLGIGSSSAEVPAAEVITAANISDEAVAFVNLARSALLTHWNTDGDLESWFSAGASAVVAGGVLTLTSISVDPQLARFGLSIAGATNTTLRARIKRRAGSGWQGTVYYSTSGHGQSESFRKTIAQPTYDANGWAITTWDMAALSAGGTDWTTNTITAIRIDLGTTASDVFDFDWVAIGSEDTQKRYTTNGTISTADARRANLESLLLPMAGNAVWVQGRWLVRAGAHRSSEFTLNESWVVRVGQIISSRPRSELFNAVTGSFIDPAQGYTEVQIPPVGNAVYEAADGAKHIVRSITMPLVNNSTRSQRLAKIALERARQALAIVIVCNMRAYDTMPTQVGTLNLARYGFTGKLVEVRRRVYNPQERTVTLTVVETAAAVWDWNFGEATLVDLAPNTTLPSPFIAPSELGGMNVASGSAHLVKLADGSIITRGLVSWTQSTDIFVARGGKIEIEWKLDDDTVWQRGAPVSGDDISAYIGPLDDDRLTLVRVRPVNAAGRAGPWAYKTHLVIGKSELPANVAGLTAVVLPGSIRFSWTASAELDYLETEIRYGASWASGTAIFRGAANTFDWSWPPAGVYTFRVRHRDTTGNESATDSTTSVITLTAASMAIDGRYLNNGTLVSASNWVIGSSGAQLGPGPTQWGDIVSTGVTNSIELGVAPDGALRAVWVASSGTSAGLDASGGIGGTNQIPVDISKPYRFSVWAKVGGSSSDGSLYFGIDPSNKVDDVPSGMLNTNPYFVTISRAAMVADRWHLLVGYVLPVGYAGAQLYLSGIYDGATGKRIPPGSNLDYRWHAGVTSASLRTFQYYTGGTGRTARWIAPRFEVLDGNEPSVQALIASAIVGTNQLAGNAATQIYQNNPATTYDISTAGTTNPLGPVTVTLDGQETAVIVSCEVTYYYPTSTAGTRTLESNIAVMVDGTGYGARSINIDTPVTPSVTNVYVPFNVGYVVFSPAAGSHTFGLDFNVLSSAGWGHSDAIQQIKTRVEIIKR
jgi:hypothetical protein